MGTKRVQPTHKEQSSERRGAARTVKATQCEVGSSGFPLPIDVASSRRQRQRSVSVDVSRNDVSVNVTTTLNVSKYVIHFYTTPRTRHGEREHKYGNKQS